MTKAVPNISDKIIELHNNMIICRIMNFKLYRFRLHRLEFLPAENLFEKIIA